MQLTVPYGYGDVAPLKKHYKVLMPASTAPIFCRTMNAIAVSFSEFAAAARDYPVVFVGADGATSFTPVAVLGLAKGVNLFVNASGDWDPACHALAYVRRYPFCVCRAFGPGDKHGRPIVCVAKEYIDASGVALFDAQGNGTAHWQAVERLLADAESDQEHNAQLCAALAQLGVLEPFSMQVMEGGKSEVRLAGMFRVNEQKLAALRPASHKALVTKGFMNRIYAHLHSLDNFPRLYAREQAQRPRSQFLRR